MKNIFITGATSFIGVNLIRELLKENYNVTAIIRKNSPNKTKLIDFNIKIIELNIEDIFNLPNLVDYECDAFYHLAWDGTRGSARNDKNLQISNYQNSIKVLEIAKKINTKVFFTAGSQAEYGLHDEIISETTKCNPNTEYGKAKLLFYNYAINYCINNNIRLIEPRFFSLYGIGDYEKTLIISTINKMLNNELIELTECVQLWNFLYIDDAVKALIKLQESSYSGVYNFGGNETKKLKEFINDIKSLISTESQIIYGVIPYTNGIINVNPSINKLKHDIQFNPEISFKEGITKILKYQQSIKKIL